MKILPTVLVCNEAYYIADVLRPLPFDLAAWRSS